MSKRTKTISSSTQSSTSNKRVAAASINQQLTSSKTTSNGCFNVMLRKSQKNRQSEGNDETDDEIEFDESKGERIKLNKQDTSDKNKIDVNDFNELILDSLSVKNEKSIKSCMDDTLLKNELKNKYVNGLIRIQDINGIISNTDGNLYLNFKLDKEALPPPGINDSTLINECLRDIPKFMTFLWNMKSPQIIIPIITGISNFKNWKNQKLEEQFRRGLIKAANKTEMWFITNGINGGISAMVGDAFNEEKRSRATTPINNLMPNINYLNDNEMNIKPLTLIGIVAASSLQNLSSFDGASAILTASGNKTTGKSSYRFDVNPDHTHFIIYDDLTINKNTMSGLLNNSSLLLNNENDGVSLEFDQFRNRLESLFTRSLRYYRKKAYEANNETSDDELELTSKPLQEHRQVPMVCLVIRGDLKSIDAIDFKISKEIPVIILKGSGAVADIVAFAYEETNENKDPNYEDNFIKPEISKKLLTEFKEELGSNDVLRNLYRDRILQIVKNSSKSGQKFLTIVDMKGLTFDFLDLDKYILTALLQSQTQLSGKQGQLQLERNLRLTLDWNCSALALSEIFQRDDYTQIEIKHGVFENALLRQDREEFVELFLDQGFYIHRYLGRNNIRDLFTKADNREFFVTIILQRILGHFTNELPENFLPEGLNEVLKHLTNIDNMINILEIYMNQLGFYVTDAKQAEKKALNFLIIFAIIFNRHKLAKVLWKRTEDPLTIALICSLIYKNLTPYCQENYLKSQIEKYQNYFGNAAIGVLDSSFQDNDPRSYSILTYKHPDWNDCTALELAYNAKNLDFIAHPCCQKLLTKRLFGTIQIRENERHALVELPSFLKVILSAFLIFPMYYWIVFPIREIDTSQVSKKKKKDTSHTNQTNNESANELLIDEEDKDEELIEAEDTKAELNKKLIEIKTNRKTSQYITKKDLNLIKTAATAIGLQSHHDEINKSEELDKSRLKSSSRLRFKLSHNATKTYVTPPFYEKIYLVWSSPFTKFWINFISYVFFLLLFGIVTLWPCCGNLILDTVLWLWTATIAVEDTRIAYKNFLTGSQLPLLGPIIEIAITILFLILFFIVRIMGSWDMSYEFYGFDRIFVSKLVLCVFLIYFYYRTLFVYLPISHKLGPMLVRIKLMVKNDFLIYLRLFCVFGMAGSIALNAIVYPFHPLNYELIKKVVLFRGFVQLFTADKHDLERKSEDCKYSNLSHKITSSYSCINLTDGINFNYPESKLNTYGVSYRCNYISLSAWLILIQYFILIKLFLPSLLTAMFSATSSRVSAISEQLWMYQRYQIVLEYEKRLMFPAPFTVILYVFMFLRWIFNELYTFFSKCHICCQLFCLRHKRQNEKLNDLKKSNQSLNDLSSNISKDAVSMHHNINNKQNTFNYWRNIAQTYAADSEKDVKEKAKQKQMETNLNKVREDLSTQKKSMQRLNDRVVGLEKSILQNQSYLEQIKNLLSQKVSGKSGLSDRKKNNYIHILSRESPYFSTTISRFFVYEKMVPWECPLELYDPPFISISAEVLNVDKIFLDEDLNSKNRDEQQQSVIATSVLSSIPPPPPHPLSAAQIYPQSPNISLKNSVLNETATATVSSTPATKIENDQKSLQNQTAITSQLSETNRTRRKSNTSESLVPKQNTFLWNSTMLLDNPPNQQFKKITIDRKSWITRIDEKSSQSYPLIYSLDSSGYPRNPMGRTGVRGRGALYRYGPNHEISVIVTRWKKQKNKPIYVERRKLLEFIAVKDKLTGLTKIPGDRILGDESKYSVVCRTFMELVFEESDVEKGFNFEEDDMLTFFASFATKTSIKDSLEALTKQQPAQQQQSKKQLLADLLNELGFISTMIYRGYIDDPRNTDNSWIEGEIWNFHYDKDDFFDIKINNQNNSKCWREVSSNVRINSNEIIADSLKEISEIHNAFYN